MNKFPYTLQEIVRELGDFIPEKTDQELYRIGEEEQIPED